MSDEPGQPQHIAPAGPRPAPFADPVLSHLRPAVLAEPVRARPPLRFPPHGDLTDWPAVDVDGPVAVLVRVPVEADVRPHAGRPVPGAELEPLPDTERPAVAVVRADESQRAEGVDGGRRPVVVQVGLRRLMAFRVPAADVEPTTVGALVFARLRAEVDAWVAAVVSHGFSPFAGAVTRACPTMAATSCPRRMVASLSGSTLLQIVPMAARRESSVVRLGSVSAARMTSTDCRSRSRSALAARSRSTARSMIRASASDRSYSPSISLDNWSARNASAPTSCRCEDPEAIECQSAIGFTKTMPPTFMPMWPSSVTKTWFS